MGLFDELKKIVSGMMSVERVGFDDEPDASGKKTKIPVTYMSFPEFDGYTKKVYEKSTPKYTRCTMKFKNVSGLKVNNYISKIMDMGYTKGSKVRYDKDNTYIIVDYWDYGKELELVFHIKL